jgi:hypothetical protein
MMAPETYSVMRVLHIALGFGGFVFGAVAIALPKFGRNAPWHRWIGRTYAVCMLGMALLSLPLSMRENDFFLLTIGVLTLSWVAGGWIALRRALRARYVNPQVFARMLRTHIALMGSSYIAAWTAFLVNVRPLGNDPLLFWLYALGPTIVGTVFLSRASARFAMTA